MRYWVMKPDPRLRARVQCYYLAHPVPAEEWNPSAAFKDEELLMPDGHSEIVLHLGGAFERRQAGGEARGASRGEIMRRSYVIGGRSRSVLTRDLERVTVAGVKLDPRVLHSLIRTPLAEFADATLSLAEIGNAALSNLEDAVAAVADCPARVASVLDAFFLRALAEPSRPRSRVDALVREIHTRRGALSILDWARAHRFDPRHVERRFADAMGLTPKRYARVIRFKHHYHMLVSGKGSAEFLDGFHDRSHFNREFRSFVGVPPSTRVKAALAHGTSISDTLFSSELATAAAH
jgi:AraC-like DNA-binding protein